jgi:hypothetical protein
MRLRRRPFSRAAATEGRRLSQLAVGREQSQADVDDARLLGPVPRRPHTWYEQHARLSRRAAMDWTGHEHMLDARSETPLCGYAGSLTLIRAGAGRPCEGCVLVLEERLRGRT